MLHDERAVLHRASCAEMIVRYGEPDPMHARTRRHRRTCATIEVEIQLHGIVSTMVPGAGPPLGSNIVDEGLVAPHHQHLFCFRLDLEVDGTANRVRKAESEPVPAGPANPVGNPFRPRITELRSELAARRDADDGRSRHWLVQSAERPDGHGSTTACRLVPGHGTATLLAHPARASTAAPASRVTGCG